VATAISELLFSTQIPPSPPILGRLYFLVFNVGRGIFITVRTCSSSLCVELFEGTAAMAGGVLVEIPQWIVIVNGI